MKSDKDEIYGCKWCESEVYDRYSYCKSLYDFGLDAMDICPFKYMSIKASKEYLKGVYKK